MTKKLHYFASFIFFLGFIACSTQNKKVEESISAFPVLQLTAMDTVLEKDYVAQIQAIKNVEIRSQASGYIKKIFVDEGQYVQQGQLLFQLNDERYRNEVEKASATVGSAFAEQGVAEVEVRRVKILAEKNVISKTELDLAEAKLKIAKAKLVEAKANEANAKILLSYAAVKAPFSGVINRVPFKLGSLVDAGSLLTTISDLNYMYAYFNLSEKEYLQYMNAKQKDSAHHSTTVNLVLADGKRYPLSGQIETMESEINTTTGSLAFRAKFKNTGNLLKHGSTAKALLSTNVGEVIFIPQKSVFEIQDKNYVYMVDKNNKVSIKNIFPINRLGNAYIIKDGLSAGDRILFEGNQTIQEGQIIKPTQIVWNGM